MYWHSGADWADVGGEVGVGVVWPGCYQWHVNLGGPSSVRVHISRGKRSEVRDEIIAELRLGE